MMELTKLKEFIMEAKIFIISVLIGVVTLILSVTYYNYHQLEAMKSNIESAIVKGIDPIAVKCAYSHSDNMCVAYAVSHGNSQKTSK